MISKLHRPTAFIEGWATYAETLGLELGLYDDDPVSLIGHYAIKLGSATGLVVDTGIHHYGWTWKEVR